MFAYPLVAFGLGIALGYIVKANAAKAEARLVSIENGIGQMSNHVHNRLTNIETAISGGPRNVSKP